MNPIRSLTIARFCFAVCLAIAGNWAAASRAPQNPPITATVQPNQDVGVAFPATMGKGPNKYSPEGGFFKVTLALTVTAPGYSFVPPSGNPPGDGTTIWQCIDGNAPGSTTQTWQAAGVADTNAWSDTLFSGLLTKTGGSGPANPTPFNASVADISIYVDALETHSDGAKGHWPPEMTSKEHLAETAEDGGFFLPASLYPYPGGFPASLDTTLHYKILSLRIPTQWQSIQGQTVPPTVGSVTFTAPAGVAIYHCGSGSTTVSGGTLIGASGIRVPAAGFPNETFAILTDQQFTQAGRRHHGHVHLGLTTCWRAGHGPGLCKSRAVLGGLGYRRP